MRYLMIILIALPLLAEELLTNGGFEDSLIIGWTQQTSGSNIVIERKTGYQNDPDYECFVYKGTGTGYAKLYQTVDLPDLNYDFRSCLKFYASDNNSGWCAAAVCVAYLNTSNSTLGETRICRVSSGCPWSNSSTLHLIWGGQNWTHHEFHIEEELTNNLPGIDPDAVKKIRVTLLDTCIHGSG